MKKIAAMLAAAAVVSSFGVSAFAEEVVEEQKELVQVGEYECWVEDGQYFTELDGEIYLVINLDELEWESEEISARSVSEVWQNGTVVDLSDGSTYYGRVNIQTKTEDSTPIFIGYTASQGGRVSYIMSTGFVRANSYLTNVHIYDPAESKWETSYDETISFSLTDQSRIIYTGATGVAPTKICITFLQRLSTGEQIFNYSFRVVRSNG